MSLKLPSLGMPFSDSFSSLGGEPSGVNDSITTSGNGSVGGGGGGGGDCSSTTISVVAAAGRRLGSAIFHDDIDVILSNSVLLAGIPSKQCDSPPRHAPLIVTQMCYGACLVSTVL